MLEAFAATVDAGEMAGETASQLTIFIESFLIKIPLFAAAILVIGLFYVFAKIGRKIVENKMAERGIEEEHKEVQILGGRVTYSSILILGITIGLKIAGIDLTSIIAAVAFGIGFALKDLIMNFLAGMMILVGRHFSIGDFINIGGTIGKIIEIQSRVTILQAIDGTKVIVPNADLFKKQVVSYTGNPFRRIEIVVGVDYRHDIDNILNILEHVVKSTPKVLAEPKSAVLVNEFGDSAIEFKIKAWVDSKGGWVKIKSELTKNIKIAFDKYGIVIPWPIRTVAYDKESPIEEKTYEEMPKAKEGEAPAAEASTENLPQNTEPTPQITSQTVVPAQVAPQEATVANDDGEQPLKPIGER